MQPGTGRILTTHSGSLPRPPGFLPLVLAQEAGQRVEDARFRTEVRAAVRETVQKQADAGVDVLNDGEVSKPSYATYVKDRLTGFGGQGSIEEVAASVMGLEDFPDFAEKIEVPVPGRGGQDRLGVPVGPSRLTSETGHPHRVQSLRHAAPKTHSGRRWVGSAHGVSRAGPVGPQGFRAHHGHDDVRRPRAFR
jgi:5-methyltetrahydropteroyltriglutamate--homocysteine methyltransferase